MTEDDLNGDEAELILNWLKLSDGQREELGRPNREGMHSA
jgi:hypothetical protein